MSLVPLEDPHQTIVQKTTLGTVDPSDSPGAWRTFWDAVRTAIGLKPIHLAERFAKARIQVIEVDNEIKQLKAREEFEKTMAEVSKIKLDGQASAEKIKAEAQILRAKARQEKAKARVFELAARQIESRMLSPEEALERLLEIKEKIELVHGGAIEFQLPKPAEDTSQAETAK